MGPFACCLLLATAHVSVAAPPDEPGPIFEAAENPGFIHTPSLAQATTVKHAKSNASREPLEIIRRSYVQYELGIGPELPRPASIPSRPRWVRSIRQRDGASRLTASTF